MKEKDFYEAVGSDYDARAAAGVFRYFIERRKEMLRSLISQDRSAVIFDLGCGTGIYRDAFGDRAHLVGSDYSLAAVRGYKAKYPAAIVINSDALSIPLKDGSVDVVIVFGLLHHLHDRADRLFSEIARILKKGGKVVIDEPNGYNIMWHLLLTTKTGRDIDGGFSKPVIPSYVKKMLSKYAFNRTFEKYWGFLPAPAFNARIFGPLDALLERSPLKYCSIRYTVVGEKC